METAIHRERSLQDRPRASAFKEDHRLSITVRRNRSATDSQLSLEFYAATRSRDSKVTVSRRLHDKRLYARIHAASVLLTFAQKRALLTMCRDHRLLSKDNWGTVLSSGESRFILNSYSRRIFILRKRGNGYLQPNVR